MVNFTWEHGDSKAYALKDGDPQRPLVSVADMAEGASAWRGTGR